MFIRRSRFLEGQFVTRVFDLHTHQDVRLNPLLHKSALQKNLVYVKFVVVTSGTVAPSDVYPYISLMISHQKHLLRAV